MVSNVNFSFSYDFCFYINLLFWPGRIIPFCILIKTESISFEFFPFQLFELKFHIIFFFSFSLGLLQVCSGPCHVEPVPNFNAVRVQIPSLPEAVRGSNPRILRADVTRLYPLATGHGPGLSAQLINTVSCGINYIINWVLLSTPGNGWDRYLGCYYLWLKSTGP